MHRFGLSAFVAATLAASALPAFAHHSDAMFDNGKEVTLSGTVKEFQYTNPHSWIQLRVAASEGATPVEWSIETAAPIVLLRAGIKWNALRPGDKVTLRAHPLKSGQPGGSLIDVKKEDGTVFNLRGGY